MAKTRLTKAKRETILDDVEARLDIGELRESARKALLLAHKAVQAAVHRACPPKDYKILSKHNCTRISQSPTARLSTGMSRNVDFWEKEARILHGKKRLEVYKGPDTWQFFESHIEVTEEEMSLLEDWKLKKAQWLEKRKAAIRDFSAVIQSANTVEDLEEVLPLESLYFEKFKKSNTALAVSGEIVDRVKSATLEPTV